MSLLVIALPAAPAGPSARYAWVASVDGQAVQRHGEASAALLPAAGRGVEVVARVPAGCLSWHRVTLPRGIGARSPRLRATLAGLLEERLLDEPDALHFALDPRARAGEPAWVAVCARAWLEGHLQALERAARTVSRVVPELSPDAGPLRLAAIGEPGQAQLLLSGAAVPGGAQLLPLAASALALLPRDRAAGADVQLEAEPAVASVTEQLLGQPLALVAPAERLLRASNSPWDLAQGELARSGVARLSRGATAAWRALLHAPHWRPARWGIALLLLSQLAGLNLLAWRTHEELQARRADLRATLTRTFPQVKVVVDAPVQMAREVALLRSGTGTAAPRDLEPMLAAYARVASADALPTALEYGAGELRLRGLQWPADTLARAQAALRPLGYRVQADADGIVMRVEPMP